MPIFNLFPIQWTYGDEFEGPNEHSIIRIFGLNEKNESVYVKIKDFHIPIWVELQTHIGGRQIIWNDRNVQSLHNVITSWNSNNNYNPSRVEFDMKHKLYYAEVEPNTDTGAKYQKKLFPFLQVYFYNMKAVGFFVKRCAERIKIPGIGEITVKPHCYAPNITPVLKLLASRKLPSSSWIKASGVAMRPKESTKQNEYVVSYLNLMKHPEGDKLPIVYPKVLSFDIEAYSYDSASMPKATRPTDVVFMIGCVIAQKGKPSKKVMLTCADYTQYASRFDFETILCKNEADVYKKFGELICKEDPDIVTGYNIFGFDLKYMHDRAKSLSCLNYLTRIGCIPDRKGEFVQKSWESSAYGKQEFMYIESDGRIFLDMFFYVVRAGFKLANYRLETVCTEFLKNQNKDPIKPKDIFKSWATKDPKLLAAVAKYCVVDSDVVIALYDKLLVWFDLTESASTNGVPLFYLYTQGQQIKMMSQMLTYCIEKNIAVQSKVMEPDPREQYSGATVTQPIAGLYKMILPFDFASLYPSIIMAYNIDYSKLVNDFPTKNTSIPDEDCHVFSWTEHVNCEHDPNAKKQKLKSGDYKMICKQFDYRFLKADKCDKGVIPTLLENLLGARKATRKVIEKQHDIVITLEKLLKVGYSELTEEERATEFIVKHSDMLEAYGITDTTKKIIEAEIDRLEEVNSVLDKRQLSYKVSANSMYGAMGVRVGYLPFLPGAQTVTYVGRRSIKLASETLQNKWNGTVIYNDTDSAYTYFESLNKLLTDSEGNPKPLEQVMPQVWAYAHTIVEDIANLFPKPMKLEFEDKVYFKFLILTKKRYMGQLCDERGVFGKLRKSGVVLQRRDNCKCLRDIYETAVNFLLKNFEEVTSIPRGLTLAEINRLPVFNRFIDTVLEMVNRMFYRVLPDTDFVITRGLTKESYKDKPPHVCVAEKMIQRGITVPQGARIEYVLLKTSGVYDKNEKQAEKVEDVNFFKEFKSFLYLDTLYYLDHQVMNPVDEVIEKVFNWCSKMYKNTVERQRIPDTRQYKHVFKAVPVTLKNEHRSKGFVEEQLEIRINKQKVLCQLKELFTPKFVFE